MPGDSTICEFCGNRVDAHNGEMWNHACDNMPDDFYGVPVTKTTETLEKSDRKLLSSMTPGHWAVYLSKFPFSKAPWSTPEGPMKYFDRYYDKESNIKIYSFGPFSLMIADLEAITQRLMGKTGPEAVTTQNDAAIPSSGRGKDLLWTYDSEVLNGFYQSQVVTVASSLDEAVEKSVQAIKEITDDALREYSVVTRKIPEDGDIPARIVTMYSDDEPEDLALMFSQILDAARKEARLKARYALRGYTAFYHSG